MQVSAWAARPRAHNS